MKVDCARVRATQHAHRVVMNRARIGDREPAQRLQLGARRGGEIGTGIPLRERDQRRIEDRPLAMRPWRAARAAPATTSGRAPPASTGIAAAPEAVTSLISRLPWTNGPQRSRKARSTLFSLTHGAGSPSVSLSWAYISTKVVVQPLARSPAMSRAKSTVARCRSFISPPATRADWAHVRGASRNMPSHRPTSRVVSG